MSFKYNQTTLHILESIFRENGYVVRYEKGSFNSGYCILQDKRVVVINKFFDTEARINTLIDIMGQVELYVDNLDEKQLALFHKLSQQKLDIE
jgi:hypothetical protein